jgi:hypothetical protein
MRQPIAPAGQERRLAAPGRGREQAIGLLRRRAEPAVQPVQLLAATSERLRALRLVSVLREEVRDRRRSRQRSADPLPAPSADQDDAAAGVDVAQLEERPRGRRRPCAWRG